jgi:hypothetical protein
VATFPSLTPSGFTAALGARSTKGYEDVYFNWESKKLEGGAIEYLFNQDGPENQGRFMTLFDFHISRLHDLYAYAIPMLAVNKEYEDFLDYDDFNKFLKPTDKRSLYKSYLVYTDPLAHIMGRAHLRKYLQRLAKYLNKIRNDYPGRLDITIISDHGNHFVRKYKQTDITDALVKAGFKIKDKLAGKNVLVVPKFGLVGYVGVFSQKSDVNKAATTVSVHKGVDITTYQKPDDLKTFVVLKNNGTEVPTVSEITVFENQNERMIKYTPISGDALYYSEILNLLRRQNPSVENDFFSEKAWFEASIDHQYPDALTRIVRGHTQFVEYPANILVSMKDGFYAGQKSMSLFTAQAGTHGSLSRGGSVTFLISTRIGSPKNAPIWNIPDIVRNDLNLPFLAEDDFFNPKGKKHAHNHFH